MRKRILVIDDDEAVRDSIATILTTMGYEIETAKDGREGYDRFRAFAPHLIMTDIVMPGQEGIETIIQIRKEDRAVKIIAMSGGGRTKDKNFLHLAEVLGADRTIEKPFAFEALLGTIDDCLR